MVTRFLSLILLSIYSLTSPNGSCCGCISHRLYFMAGPELKRMMGGFLRTLRGTLKNCKHLTWQCRPTRTSQDFSRTHRAGDSTHRVWNQITRFLAIHVAPPNKHRSRSFDMALNSPTYGASRITQSKLSLANGGSHASPTTSGQTLGSISN